MNREQAVEQLFMELHQKYRAIYQRLDMTARAGGIEVTYKPKTDDDLRQLAGEMLDQEILTAATNTVLTRLRAA